MNYNKMRNAQKRFRQSRITYGKLKELYQRYAKEIVSEVSAEHQEKVEHTEHVHGEHCNHDHVQELKPASQDDALNDSWFAEEVVSPVDEPSV